MTNIGTLLEAIAVMALVFSGGGLWVWGMFWLLERISE